jgi:hypothetical protein
VDFDQITCRRSGQPPFTKQTASGWTATQNHDFQIHAKQQFDLGGEKKATMEATGNVTVGRQRKITLEWYRVRGRYERAIWEVEM